MPGFSFLSRSDRELIDQTAMESGETKRDVEQMVPGGFADFPAKLTAYDSSSGYYSWTRRAFDSNRARYDHPATVQVGTPTSNAARFPNGDVVDVSTPVDVWLRPVGIRTTVGMVHEVIAPPAATTTAGAQFINSWTETFGPGGSIASGVSVTLSDILGTNGTGLHIVSGVIYFSTLGILTTLSYQLQIGSLGAATIHPPNPLPGFIVWDAGAAVGSGIIPVSQFVTVSVFPCTLSVKFTCGAGGIQATEDVRGGLSIAGVF